MPNESETVDPGPSEQRCDVRPLSLPSTVGLLARWFVCHATPLIAFVSPLRFRAGPFRKITTSLQMYVAVIFCPHHLHPLDHRMICMCMPPRWHDENQHQA